MKSLHRRTPSCPSTIARGVCDNKDYSSFYLISLLPSKLPFVDDISSTVQHESGSPDPTSSLCLPLLDLHLKSKSFFRARCSSVSRSAKQRESGCGHDFEPGVAFFPFLPINAR